MATPVVTVASGGLPVAETASGMPVSEAANGLGLAVTKVVGKPGLPVTFTTVGGGAAATAKLDTTANAALSNGNLTVTHSNTTQGGGRSAALKTSGKYYFEVTIGTRGGQLDAINVGPSTVTYANSFSFGVNVMLDTTNFAVQNIYSDGGGTNKKIGPIVNGSIIGVAVDMDNKRLWARLGSGLWNGDGAANTNTPSTGITLIQAGGHAPLLLFDGSGTAAGHNYTINFGATAYANAAPSGFGIWTA